METLVTLTTTESRHIESTFQSMAWIQPSEDEDERSKEFLVFGYFDFVADLESRQLYLIDPVYNPSYGKPWAFTGCPNCESSSYNDDGIEMRCGGHVYYLNHVGCFSNLLDLEKFSQGYSLGKRNFKTRKPVTLECDFLESIQDHIHYEAIKSLLED